MRILSLSYEFPPLGGGGARVVEGLARELTRIGLEVDIVTMGFPGLPDHEDVEGFNLYRLASVRKRADICHTREMVPHLLSAYPLVKRLVATRKYDIIWRCVVRNAARVICPSVHLQGLLKKVSNSAKSEIIPNGMSEDKFNPVRTKRMRILVVTRMFERKDVQYLLKALRGRTLDCEINIVGDGPYLETLKRMAMDTPADIHFWGWLNNESDELKELYETSRIFVFTSQRENFPVNLLEAMTAGMAIVISEDPGSAEVVGDAALHVPDNQPEQFFDTLQRLVRDPVLCDELGRKARRRFETHFTWPTIAREYHKLFEKVLC